MPITTNTKSRLINCYLAQGLVAIQRENVCTHYHVHYYICTLSSAVGMHLLAVLPNAPINVMSFGVEEAEQRCVSCRKIIVDAVLTTAFEK